MIDLSVLVCTVNTRWNTFFPRIQRQLWGQYEKLPAELQGRVEILMLADNKTMMLGHKRNMLVDLAQGRYVVFVDDDDRVADDYLETLIRATARDTDVITFRAAVTVNGDGPKTCHYSRNFRHDRNTFDGYERLPNHICCVRRSIALEVPFPHIAYGEDSGYSKLLREHLHTEHSIERVLYHYDYSDQTTEAQEHKRNAPRRRPGRQPIVDVVILSRADEQWQAEMTQRAIDTCRDGANGLPVNVIVVENSEFPLKYRGASTIHRTEEFNYNRLANVGAAGGTAEWIMVANNDLIFQDAWLHRLLAAEHPVVSPRCPRDSRQRHISENACGYTLVENFSGWCFMLRRELWRKMGGFDDCVRFWCSDDVVLEQLKALDVQPMLVADAFVEHLMSQTLNSHPDREELMWPDVAVFNDLFGGDKFADDPRYRRWRRRHAG